MRQFLFMCAILMTSAYVTRAETTPGVYDTFMESQNGTETEEEDNVILGYDMCSQDECGCPKPNQFPGKIVQIQKSIIDENGEMKELDCLCSCGNEPGDVCSSTADCGFGTRCTAPTDFQTHSDRSLGVCSDRCNYVECPQFHGCYINPNNGEAMCVCKEYECSNTLVIPVKGQRGSELRLFDNKCELVNENCRELQRDPNAAMWTSVPINTGV